MIFVLSSIIIIVFIVIVCFNVGGFGNEGVYGIVIVVVGMLFIFGVIFVIDVYGLVVDNVGGIVEMFSDVSDEVRDRIDKFDVFGNIIVVIGKGFVIGFVVLIVFFLMNVFVKDVLYIVGINDRALGFVLTFIDSYVFFGVIFGVMLLFFFVVFIMFFVCKVVGVIIVEV